MQQDYIQEYHQKNIVCEFIVGKTGIFATDCKKNNYKKLQKNNIIKKYFIIHTSILQNYPT